jgi:hypothetical protein
MVTSDMVGAQSYVSPAGGHLVILPKSVEDMFGCLVQHGCANLSLSLDPNQSSSSPIANGGFGDVYRVILDGGSIVALKTLRLPKLLAGNTKGAKVDAPDSVATQLTLTYIVYFSVLFARYTIGRSYIILTYKSY